MPTFKRGLRPLDRAKHNRFKSVADYGFTFPAVTYPIDKSGGITDYGMGGNGPDPSLTVNGGNPVGDCGVAAYAHLDMIDAALTGEDVAANTMTSNAVVTLYFEYEATEAGVSWRPPAVGTPWTQEDIDQAAQLDNGVDLGDWLLYLYQQGLIDGFVKITDAEAPAALSLFGPIVTGVILNSQADEQFSTGQPWDVGPGDEPDPNEGHAIDQIKAESATGPYGWCSWGADQPSTQAWVTACVQQRFAVLTKEQAEAVGFPFAALDADLKALGGTAVTPPAPAPPEPTPPPAPTPPPVTPPAPTPPPSPIHPTRKRRPWWEEIRKVGEDIEHLFDRNDDTPSNPPTS